MKSAVIILCGMFLVSPIAYGSAHTIDTSPVTPADLSSKPLKKNQHDQKNFKKPERERHGQCRNNPKCRAKHQQWCENHPEKCQRHRKSDNN